MKIKLFFILLFFLARICGTLCAKQQDKYIEISSRTDTIILENIRAVTCDGDTTAYKELMLQIPYYDFFVYSVYMASVYNYAPAYYHVYRLYYKWLNLYDTQIDTTSWRHLRFWLQWGVDVGNSACEKILCDSVHINDIMYSTLDSLNDFVFVIPQTDDSCDSIRTYINTVKRESSYLTTAGKEISISKELFEKYKKLRISNNDSVSKVILEKYAHYNDNTEEIYTINNTDAFPKNENFMFRVHEHLKFGNCTYITISILWYLEDIHRLCYDYFHTYGNKLGLYLLHLGYEAGDTYAIYPLAKMYTEGYYVPQDVEYAKTILTSFMSEDKAQRWIQKWIREMK